MSADAMALPKGTLVESATEAVREHIRLNQLKVGDVLPSEGSFASELGVSRPVMREAFHALAALKMIDVGNGRRARVGAIDGSVMAASIGHAVNTAQVSLADVWDVRRTLELRTAELAARNRTDQQADAIVTAAHTLAMSRDETTRTAADTAFHQSIALASGNQMFFQIVRSFEQMMQIAIPKAWAGRATDAEREESLALHREVADAIANRDPVSAREAMESHFARSIGELFHRSES
ncbi:FadR/GntR family transcriptional regulator [Tsuneonella rigui]|uniref:FadR/GntR family transcriptional regulator n=1 Tax=Tsuneonella rigui TaxID=1708790 RepID=UPI000F7EEE40|nr:FCD domain-containing protein [Tsuneonella rigui]